MRWTHGDLLLFRVLYSNGHASFDIFNGLIKVDAEADAHRLGLPSKRRFFNVGWHIANLKNQAKNWFSIMAASYQIPSKA